MGQVQNKLEVLLSSEGYGNIRTVQNHGVCGIMGSIFTADICCDMDMGGLKYRYCYPYFQDAAWALSHWDGGQHPPGNWIKRKGDGEDIPNPEHQVTKQSLMTGVKNV